VVSACQNPETQIPGETPGTEDTEQPVPGGPAGTGADDASGVAANAPADAAADANDEGKSIIRPAVTKPVPEAPEIKPVTVTIALADRSDELTDAARTKLDGLLDTAVMQEGGKITLRGHTDSRGYDGDNLVVSRKRAEAVRDYLAGKGVAAARMTVIALGETRPVAPNAMEDGSDNPEGRARNRRVDITVEPAVSKPPANSEGRKAP
jgi:OOP family OmpA-OmpF porin